MTITPDELAEAKRLMADAVLSPYGFTGAIIAYEKYALDLSPKLREAYEAQQQENAALRTAAQALVEKIEGPVLGTAICNVVKNDCKAELAALKARLGDR